MHVCATNVRQGQMSRQRSEMRVCCVATPPNVRYDQSRLIRSD
ncbi:hypothetical protein C7S16_2402 [Burkholderia thailandensis]|uniref:Uncharacterized protein n=1 Tax=Burkholderia thailandensis TaxID=57975 RepID=A0AAW9D4M7_BURTH|nr:hypothetical protein [Burkholderia thailandensis]MDW9256913.1 hypothetical protein [Burkholderia thailandensis]